MATGQDVKVFTLEHVRAHGYKSEYVTGGMVAGPFGDGLHRLTLFRDAVPLVSEQLEVLEDNGREVLGMPVAPARGAPMIREDVVTLIVTDQILENLGKTLIQHAERQKATE